MFPTHLEYTNSEGVMNCKCDSLWLSIKKPQIHLFQKFSTETVREAEQCTQGVKHISFERIEVPVVYY